MKNKNAFPKIKGKVLLNEPLSRHTTFRIGGPCGAWAEPADESDLKNVLRFAASERKKMFVLGMGSNVLFGEKGFNGILIHTGAGDFKKVKFTGQRAVMGAGALLGCAVNLACSMGLSGIEGLAGIPGTLGGAIFMNAGYRGCISDCLESVRVIDKASGEPRTIKRKNIDFGYRHSGILRDFIILEATLKLKKSDRKMLLRKKSRLLRAKTSTQPLGFFSAGCVFKNPDKGPSAAKLIEASRLKGKRIGDAKISEKHANFIINLKNAKGSDVLSLMELVKNRVNLKFGVDLTPEIVIV